MIGSTISHYKILEKLGEGGMGIVYKARDTKLDRDVALKFLPYHLSVKGAEQARFLQEARAAATMNHPNVCTIFDIKEEDGQQYIVMEFVDGTTLRHLVAGSPLGLSDAITYAIQIGEALQEAHSKGIVHRDVKAENIMVNPKKQIKVMDFGLAKLKGSLKLTKTSSTVGTLAYMAPEQIQGGEVDARSDIFSFGVLLFEMLSGKFPFRGEHEAAMLYSIVNEDPEPITKYVPDLSAEVIHILGKALEKDPADRYQAIDELVVDLRRVKKLSGRVSRIIPAVRPQVPHIRHAEAVTTSSTFTPLPTKPRKRTIALIAAITVLACLIIAVLITFRQGESNRPSFSTMRMTRLTNSGDAGYATISPDGKYVVYARGERGEVSLWIRQVVASTDVMVIPPSDILITGSSFSNDGNYIFYTASTPDAPTPAVYRMPVLGGAPPTRILANIAGSVSLSPDDSRLAFFRSFPNTGEEALFVANADGTGEKMLTRRDGKSLFYLSEGAAPAWSRDGSVIACPAGSVTDAMRLSLLLVALKDPREVMITERYWADVGRIAWYPDGSGLVFCSQDEGESFQISYMSYPRGELTRITNDLLTYGPTSLSTTADGSAIVSVQTGTSATVVVSPGGDGSRVLEVTSGASRNDGNRGIAWTSDGRIIYSSNRGRTTDLWVSDLGRGSSKQLTFSKVGVYDPATSPTRREVFYLSFDERISHVWKMNQDGSKASKVTDAEDYSPDVSRDGKWLLFDSWRSGARSVWKLEIDGKDTATIFQTGATDPKISPDGRFVACIYYDENEKRERIGVLSFPDGRLVAVFDLPLTATASRFGWAPDGKSIHYIDTRKGVSNIWAYDYVKNAARQVSTFTSGRIFSFAWSPDGRGLAVSRGQTTSDVVLLTMTE